MKINLAALILTALISHLAIADNDNSDNSAIAHLDPQQVLIQCQDPNGPGPIGVMWNITHPNGQDYDWDIWDDITEQIAKGNAAWIKASGCLAHGARYGSCASCNNMLKIAWAHALITNTRAVLELRRWTSIDEACSLPFIEEGEDFLAQYMDKSIAALNLLTTKPEVYGDILQDARRSCIWSLKATYLYPNRCQYNGYQYICPKVKQTCKFNGDNYYDCTAE